MKVLAAGLAVAVTAMAFALVVLAELVARLAVAAVVATIIFLKLSVAVADFDFQLLMRLFRMFDHLRPY